MNALIQKYGKKVGIPLIVLIAIIFPQLHIGDYYTRVAVTIMVYAILGEGLNIITGLTGQISWGHSAFFAVGAYTGAILTKTYGWSFYPGMIAAAVLAGLFGLVLGLPSIRLQGAYLVIVTSGFSQIVNMLTLNLKSLTNGAMGMKMIPKPTLFGHNLTVPNTGMYYLILIMLIITVYICYAIKNSKMGRALRAIGNDQLAVNLMGISAYHYKVAAFAISAIIAGAAGAFYAALIGSLDPFTFSTDMSTVILCIVLLGGRGSIPGMIVSSAILLIFPEVARFMTNYRFIVYGVLIIVIMKFKPDGLFGGKSKNPYEYPKGVAVSEGGDQ